MCVSSTVTSFGQSCFFTLSKLLNHLLHFLKNSVICLKLKFPNFCNLDIRNWLSGTYLPGPESAILFEFEKVEIFFQFFCFT